MINYYQPFLLPFLKHTPYRLPVTVRRTYFLSFEDGLWVLLKKMRIPKGSTILIPDFYCTDVVDNIRTHGFIPVLYPLDDQLSIADKKLTDCIRKHAPSVIIIFHACGIRRITRQKIESLCAEYPDTLILEDSVHRLLNPNTISLTHPNHYIMDSLRKVSPLPGSFLYQNISSPVIRPDAIRHEWRYTFFVHLTFWFFRTVFIVGTLLHNGHVVRYAHEKTLKVHDDIVGDSDGGYTGFSLIPHIHAFIDFEKIQRLKETQVRLYETYMPDVLKSSPSWYQFQIADDQKKELHVYPIGLKKFDAEDISGRIESYLHKHGIIVWFKFPDALWCRKNGILFLPLGFHISPKHIRHIMNIIQSAA